MKKYFYYMMLFMGLMLGMSACGDDNKDDIPGPSQGTEYGKWEEKGNQLIYTYKYSGYGVSYDVKWTMTFDANDLCTSVKCVYTFSSSKLADECYNDIKDEGYPVTKSGKTVTVDYTEDFGGLDKALLKSAIEAMSKANG